MATYIKQTVTTEIVIERSRFIGILSPCSSKAELDSSLINTRMQHPKANHVVHAALFDQQRSLSDDGEPAKTAASPMLEVLQHQDLHNVVMIAIRYFGGIKLGAGGLVRAYTKTAADTIKLAVKYAHHFCPRYELICSYEVWNKLIAENLFFQKESLVYEDVVTAVVVLEKANEKHLLTYEYLIDSLKELSDAVVEVKV